LFVVTISSCVNSYSISNFLSAFIAKEYFTSKYIYEQSAVDPKPYSLIQMVNTEELLAFAQHDRTLIPKYNNTNALEEIEKRCESIADIGLIDNLIMDYNWKSNKAIIREGNTRLAYAKIHSIKYLPVKVITTDDDDNEGEFVNVIPQQRKKYILPSELGFSVLQPNIKLHPFFTNSLTQKIFNDLQQEGIVQLQNDSKEMIDEYNGIIQKLSQTCF
jgi:hypothetical protein